MDNAALRNEVSEMDGRNRMKLFEKLMSAIFLICAAISVLSLIVITVYVFAKGTPAIFKVGVWSFLSGTSWQPQAGIFGLLPMITASILGTLGAILIGVSIGLFTAIFLSEIAPKRIANIMRPAVELLAGIPSVVYGFFGLMVLVPIIRQYLGGAGNSLLAVIIILAVMILPTVISISETSIRAVPAVIKEGSLALGASHMQTIFKVIIPSARSGIMAAIVLGTGRAIGETMAVILVSGNTALIPHALTDRVRTLTANIALEMGYASGLHQETLFATGVVLFVFIMLLNIVLNVILYSKAGDRA
jgi:phosphate transport system permease protein